MIKKLLGMGRWRKIRVGLLFRRGVTYRIFIIFCQTIFFYVLTGMWVWALSMSIGWNIINICLYYLYHYLWARTFKIGVNNE